MFQLLYNAKQYLNDRQQWIPSASVYSEAPRKKGKLAPLQERKKMVDRIRLWVKGGRGGDGCTSYRRSRHARRAAPDGGKGGKGGDVILESSAAVWDLSNLQHHLNAQKGGHGFPKNKVGSRGADKVVQVPVGTVIHLVSGVIPSTVQSTPLQEMFPWEIPTTDLESNKHVDLELQNDKNDSCTEALEVYENTKGYGVPLNRKDKKNRMEVSSCKIRNQTPNSKQLDDEKWLGFDESCSHSESSKKKSSWDDWEYEGDEDFEGEEGSQGEESEAEMIEDSVAEFVEPGQRLLVACGGDGGRGNIAMARDPRIHRTKLSDEHDSTDDLEDTDMEFDGQSHKDLQRCEHDRGQPGTEAVLILELKTIADIGLVGAPNAGKSTLLGAISRAKPSVGHYAFTTLRPNIGKLEYEDFFRVTVADIPGIIKGAHENRGLGHAFLRHIERTKALAYVVDLSSALGDRKGLQPWHQLRDLVFELEQHQPGLSDRSSLIVANKIDENGAEEVFEELKQRIPSVPIYPVCAVLEEGIPELKVGLRELIDGPKKWKLELTGICVD